MKKIYTAGKMLGLTYQDQMSWRHEAEREIESKTDELIKFIHPPLFYNYDTPTHKTEREVKDWALSQIKDCDIIVVNLEGITESIGTHYELATANAINTTGMKHIYVIGFGNPGIELHPWIELSLHRREDTLDAATDYICRYLLD